MNANILLFHSLGEGMIANHVFGDVYSLFMTFSHSFPFPYSRDFKNLRRLNTVWFGFKRLTLKSQQTYHKSG